jgi:hypothetical protein
VSKHPLPSLTIVVPTIGRPTLATTLASIARQDLHPGDRVIVALDTFEQPERPDIVALVASYGFELLPVDGGVHFFGNPQLNAAIRTATTECHSVPARHADRGVAQGAARALAREEETHDPTLVKPNTADVAYHAGVGILEMALRQPGRRRARRQRDADAPGRHPDDEARRPPGHGAVHRVAVRPCARMPRSRRWSTAAGRTNAPSCKSFQQVNPNTGYLPHAWHPGKHYVVDAKHLGDLPSHMTSSSWAPGSGADHLVQRDRLDRHRSRAVRDVEWPRPEQASRRLRAWSADHERNVGRALSTRKGRPEPVSPAQSVGNRHSPPVASLNRSARAPTSSRRAARFICRTTAEVREVFGDLVPTFRTPSEAAALIRLWLRDAEGRARSRHSYRPAWPRRRGPCALRRCSRTSHDSCSYRPRSGPDSDGCLCGKERRHLPVDDGQRHRGLRHQVERVDDQPATDKIEVTAFGDLNKTYVQGLPDLQGSFKGFWDDTESKPFTGASSTDGVKMYLYPSSDAPTKYWYGPAWLDVTMDVPVSGSVSISGASRRTAAGANRRGTRRRPDQIRAAGFAVLCRASVDGLDMADRIAADRGRHAHRVARTAGVSRCFRSSPRKRADSISPTAST